MLPYNIVVLAELVMVKIRETELDLLCNLDTTIKRIQKPQV